LTLVCIVIYYAHKELFSMGEQANAAVCYTAICLGRYEDGEP